MVLLPDFDLFSRFIFKSPPHRILAHHFTHTQQSAADLFRMLIGDLSQGRIIRQQRAVNVQGQFLKKSRRGTLRNVDGGVVISAFDNKEAYELTELGRQFVQYLR